MNPPHARFSWMAAIAVTCSSGCTRQLTVSNLQSQPVVGSLGVPLGTIVKIRATVVALTSGSETHSARFLLQIDEIEGHPVSRPFNLSFFTEYETPSIPTSTAQEFLRKNGRPPTPRDSDQLAEIERQYANKSYQFVVYESGLFGGRPTGELPAHAYMHAGPPFTFMNSLRVIGQWE